MSDRIIVGVDGSGPAQSALLWACDEARHRRAELVIVHADVPAAAAGRAPDSNTDYDSIVLKEAIVTAVEAGGEFPMSTLRRPQPAADVLLELSEDADLVVVGTHGLSRTAGTALGSVAYRVAGQARCPVAVVPEHAADHLSTDRGIAVVGVSFSAVGRNAIEVALAEARRRGIPLVALRATTQSGLALDDDRGKMGDLVDHAHESHPDVHVLAELVQDSPSDALLASTKRADLLVLGRHGTSTRTDGLGPVTARLMHKLSCPVLVCGPARSPAAPDRVEPLDEYVISDR